jgi:flagellar basal-body rod modification protein FlgD
VTTNPIGPVDSTAPGADGQLQRTDAPLDKNAFLTLLVAQLTHQNPLEPQADGEFLAQLAQFSSLESLQGIKDDMSALRGFMETTFGTPVPDSQEGE